MTALMLARIQFAFTVSFHIIFPAITIGLSSYLVFLESRWLRTKDPAHLDLYQYWMKIFAVNFGMGVVSGLVMAYQFGTNWSFFSEFSGGITGPLLAYEVMTAFFLEAGFLGVMLFGWNKVGPKLHFFATIMVALGTIISSFWILSSNSWMQTPQGFDIVAATAEKAAHVVPTDWFKIIFNPSFPIRLIHMNLAAFLSTALFVAAAGGWHLLHNNNSPAVKKMFSFSMWMVLVLSITQLYVGDQHGLNAKENQPIKVAAMEGYWHDAPEDKGMPLVLFAWPDQKAEKNHFEIAIPYASSIILTHSLTGKIPSLTSVPAEDRPPVWGVFWSFRIMVGLGILMILLGLWGTYARYKGTLYQSKWLLRSAVLMGPTGLICVLAGWFVTELGRQPWIIQGIMRTKDAVSAHSVEPLLISLLLFVIIYFAVFGTGIYYMLRIVRGGPKSNTLLQHKGA